MSDDTSTWQRPEFVQTFWLVSWARPSASGEIDYRDCDSEPYLHDTRQKAEDALAEERNKHPDAYLVRVTYAREDPRAVR
jgi:hypothetical protein